MTVLLILPMPLAEKPVAPPVVRCRERRPGERGRQRVGDRGAGRRAWSGIGDDDRISDGRARRGTCLSVGIGDLQVGLRRERVGVDGAVVGRIRIRHPGGRSDGGRIGQRARGSRVQVALTMYVTVLPTGMFTVLLMLPVALAGKPVAPPVAVAV